MSSKDKFHKFINTDFNVGVKILMLYKHVKEAYRKIEQKRYN